MHLLVVVTVLVLSLTCADDKVISSEREWKSWGDAEMPEEEEFPCGYQYTLDVFR